MPRFPVGTEKEDSGVSGPLKIPTPRDGKLSTFFIQFAIVAVAFFAIGFAFGDKKLQVDRKGYIPKISVSNQEYTGKNQNIDFSLFWQVYDTLPVKYLDKSAIDGNKILYGAISGMVKSLGDPYTAFLDPKQNQNITDELAGSFQGVGIQIGFNKDKRLVVIAPLKGTPAERAGVLAKDLIIKIDTKDTFDMTLPEAVDMIRGAAGTKVKLSLARDGVEKPIEKDLERAQITVKSVELELKDVDGGKIAVIHVSRFGETTDKEWDTAIGEIVTKDVRGVIVDMRNNPGGLLTSAIHLGSEFVSGTIVKQQFADGSVQELPADHAGKLMKMPMVVLVNGGSASASEIFSGAIQDKGRGKLVGEKSFGKGTVQDVLNLPGGSGLHVTIAKWLTPKGTSIHGVGITPDINVELGADDREKSLDPQLSRALELLK